jgi:hypothetical protein
LIGSYQIQGANDQLLKSFEVDDDTVRYAIILSLGQVKIPSNLPVILKTWNNTNELEGIRKNALKALGYFNSDEAVTTLISELSKNSSLDIVIPALGMTGSPKAAEPLLNMIKSGSNSDLSALALTNLKIPSTYPVIVDILKQKLTDYSFDKTMIVFVELLAAENYTPAQDIIAKIYLFSSEFSEISPVAKAALKRMNLKQAYCIVTATALNLRDNPNTRSSITGLLNTGEMATILEATPIKYTIDNKQDYWYKVKSEKGNIGWVYGGYLKKLDPSDLTNIVK